MAAALMMGTFIRKFYSLLMWAAQPFLRRKLLRRGQAEPGYLEAVDERFGFYTQALETSPSWSGSMRSRSVKPAPLRFCSLPCARSTRACVCC